MYRNCIFCSAEFASNDSLEAFPVGRQLAFDPAKGRLWAVCELCGRWNLAPIEERWEVLEDAERLYHDTRMRVQQENIGLARLPDGTRLIRVGTPVQGELAAWRYGSQLLRRRKRYILVGGGGAALLLGVTGGLMAVGSSGVAISLLAQAMDKRRKQKIIARIHTPVSADPVVVRRWHVEGLSFGADPATRALQVHIRDGTSEKPTHRGSVEPLTNDIIVVGGAPARQLLARAMIHVNRSGASRQSLHAANDLLAQAGSADALIADLAGGEGAALGGQAGYTRYQLEGASALAFEMALNEESERRALEGELGALRAAWKEAEEIAAIADALPGEAALNLVLARMGF